MFITVVTRRLQRHDFLNRLAQTAQLAQQIWTLIRLHRARTARLGRMLRPRRLCACSVIAPIPEPPTWTRTRPRRVKSALPAPTSFGRQPLASTAPRERLTTIARRTRRAPRALSVCMPPLLQRNAPRALVAPRTWTQTLPHHASRAARGPILVTARQCARPARLATLTSTLTQRRNASCVAPGSTRQSQQLPAPSVPLAPQTSTWIQVQNAWPVRLEHLQQLLHSDVVLDGV